MFNEVDDKYYVATASIIEEAMRLLEVGFGFVADMDGKKLFMKRK